MAIFSPFEQSLWFATAPDAAAGSMLEGEVQADVCVVGGGYTGLTTALELARQGVAVVLLEAQEAGFGGSGRNAGHCTPTFTHYSLPELHKLLGAPWAERLIARQTQANKRVAAMIERYQIACEWQQNGYIQAAAWPGAVKTIRQKVRDYNAAGAQTRLLSAQEVETLSGSPRFYGGWFHPEGGHLNPLGYARGLARAVMAEGGRIFTRSAVSQVTKQGQRWRVATERGSVLAEKVIFATGAYTVNGWPGLAESFKIMKVFVAATQPLADATRRQVLPANTTIHDGRGDIYVYKYNAEGRIVASMFPMGQRGRDLALTHKIMSDRLQWLHPQISEPIRWDYLWFGELDMQQRTIPRLYQLAPGVVALTGLSGRGVPTGSMLGSILSEWALDVPQNQLALKIEPLHRAPFWMGFGPHLTLRYYRVRDWMRSKAQRSQLPPHA
ncbi:YD repeat-containing protein [Erwinia toletana]|uniref:YD repeat-containing protein n=1 Tax=Winslowiella toletana TaxID=92490 RepID=A0ABS4P6F6_9GAMM|nr:FAD-binding oxidoreductase [Winslowiella toletana]MBP2168228.1 YD repeat-containing protein [Winslowiella toletana]